LASRKELEKPHEKEDPEVTDPFEQEKDTTSMLPRAEEIPWAHQEHVEEVETDDGIFNCEVTDAEFQLLVDAGVLQESYGFMLAPVDDQLEHLSFPPGGSLVHPTVSSELQMQHPAPNFHGFGGSYGFAASEPQVHQVQEYRWQGLQKSDNTLPGAADRQPTPPQAAQSLQHKQASMRQGGTSAALRGSEAWDARQSESPEAGGDAHSEGEPLGEKHQDHASDGTKAANSGKATKKATSSTSWQKKRRARVEKRGQSCNLLFFPLDMSSHATPSDNGLASAAACNAGIDPEGLSKGWDAPAVHQWEADAGADTAQHNSSASEYADVQDDLPEDAEPVAGSALHSARALRSSRTGSLQPRPPAAPAPKSQRPGSLVQARVQKRPIDRGCAAKS